MRAITLYRLTRFSIVSTKIYFVKNKTPINVVLLKREKLFIVVIERDTKQDLYV